MKYTIFTAPEHEGVLAGVTLKDEGNPLAGSFKTDPDFPETNPNIDEFLKQVDVDPENYVLASQVHGNEALYVSEPAYIRSGCDALVTDVPGLLLGIRVADCAGLIIFDSENRILAAVHAGWRGAVSGVLQNTLALMVRKGADRAHLRVFMSPCISARAFEVGEEVAEQFPEEFIHRSFGPKPHIDLKGFLKKVMMDEGVREKNISVDERCTVLNNEELFSYRKEGEQSGRLLVFGVIRPQN